jgi:hypothetical protein
MAGENKSQEGIINAAQAAASASPAPDESIIDKEKAELTGLMAKVEDLEIERLAALRKDLLEIEQRVNKKIQNFRVFVENTDLQGKGMAGYSVQETDEDKKKRENDDEVRKMLAGTGLEKRVLG